MSDSLKWGIYIERRYAVQDSVLGTNLKKKFDIGHLALHVNFMFSPNYGTCCYSLENCLTYHGFGLYFGLRVYIFLFFSYT